MRRHDLLRVDPAAWQAMLDRHPGLSDPPLVAGWAGHGWPVIVRRRLPGDRPDDVPAALALPPSHGKRRLAFAFPPDAGLLARPPVCLRAAACTAPAAWQTLIGRLLALATRHGAVARVYGALLWQHLTGLAYLTPRSDLDLLWSGLDQTTLSPLVAELHRLDGDSPVRIDGEVELPDGAAFHWRELASPDGTVLLKTMAGVATRPVARLFDRNARS